MKTWLLLIFCLLLAQELVAQSKVRNYLIEFTDRNNSPYSLSSPSQFLSARALERRRKQGIALVENDLPVNPAYIDSLKKSGAKILFTTRWFNAAAIELTDTTIIDKINNYSFVKQAQRLRKRADNPVKTIQLSQEEKNINFNNQEYGESFRQISVHNGHQLHKVGLQGQGMLIAVLDAGFIKVNLLQAFKQLRENNQIVAERNFVDAPRSIYEGATHGMYVLSVIGGKLEAGLLGTAPKANFILAKSENDTSEFLVEEDAWAAAAEWADSSGADIINSSLGYTTFDDPRFNHTYQDLNGRTTHVTLAAAMAARKGMIVVNSAGNSGATAWHYLSAPADADSILTIGAINKEGFVAPFSSRGPSADGRVKPDVVAVGVATVCASPKDGELAFVGGTSLSAPVITGLTACLWQAFPGKTNMEIINAIRKSSDLYANPNDSAGYGLPDFVKAYYFLKGEPLIAEKDKVVAIYPNPTNGHVFIDFYSKDKQDIKIIISDALGRTNTELNQQVNGETFNRLELNELKNIPNGVYLLSILAKDQLYTKKIVKDSGL